MTNLSVFFQDSASQLDTFYPSLCLVAVFPNLAGAERARKSLHDAGSPQEVISASGDELMQFAESQRLNTGLWGTLMTELSRGLGTGAVYADQDLEAASKGAAFLIVHCPSDEVKAYVWNLLKLSNPVSARYYGSGGIEHL